MKTYTFRPPLWALLLTVLLAAGMVAAGAWQYGRGTAKQRQALHQAEQAAAQPLPLREHPQPPPAGERRLVTVEGMYASRLTVQLDNQPYQQRPGIHAWTPLILESGEVVVVDRGWLPLGAAVPPAPQGLQQVRGFWRRLPVPGMRLAATGTHCVPPRPERVSYPDHAEMRCLFGPATLDGVLELDASAPGGFVREWARSGAQEIPPERHFAYAGQWWFFAATLIALFIKLHLKKSHAGSQP